MQLDVEVNVSKISARRLNSFTVPNTTSRLLLHFGLVTYFFSNASAVLGKTLHSLQSIGPDSSLEGSPCAPIHTFQFLCIFFATLNETEETVTSLL